MSEPRRHVTSGQHDHCGSAGQILCGERHVSVGFGLYAEDGISRGQLASLFERRLLWVELEVASEDARILAADGEQDFGFLFLCQFAPHNGLDLISSSQLRRGVGTQVAGPLRLAQRDTM
jgi:hypothetical protein